MTEDEMIQYLDEANNLLHSLCEQYGLKQIDAVLKVFTDDPLRAAKFCSNENCIALNINHLGFFRNAKRIRHEFRHYWQREICPKVYVWWLLEHKDLYRDFQNAMDDEGCRLAYLYCPIEKDAVAFESGDVVDENEVRNPILDEFYWRNILKDKTVKVLEE